jgi:hypothetical protein
VLFFYKDDKPKGFKLLNNISKQAKFYLVCLIEIKLFGHTQNLCRKTAYDSVQTFIQEKKKTEVSPKLFDFEIAK